jgi:hypothetical protein
MLIKDNANAANCVLHFNGAGAIHQRSCRLRTLAGTFARHTRFRHRSIGNQLQRPSGSSVPVQYTANLPGGFR